MFPLYLSAPHFSFALPWAGSSDIFYFCPSSKGRGWGGGGVQRGGGLSLKSEEKGGKKGGGGVDAGKGSGAFLGGRGP